MEEFEWRNLTEKIGRKWLMEFFHTQPANLIR